MVQQLGRLCFVMASTQYGSLVWLITPRRVETHPTKIWFVFSVGQPPVMGKHYDYLRANVNELKDAKVVPTTCVTAASAVDYPDDALLQGIVFAKTGAQEMVF